MTLTSCELREKDVINVCDGKKLGYIYAIWTLTPTAEE